MFLRHSIAGLVLLGAPSAMADAAVDTSAGKACFDKFVTLEAAYDPKAIDMFDSNAFIEYTLNGADGTKKVQAIPYEKYKAEFLESLPQLKAEKSKETYKDVVVVAEGKRYKVTGIDYSSINKIDVSFSAVIGLNEKDECVIYELKMNFPPLPQ